MLRVGGSLLRKVPELDRAIGVYFYYTDTPGIGGVLRKKIEDFVSTVNNLDEISSTSQELSLIHI